MSEKGQGDEPLDGASNGSQGDDGTGTDGGSGVGIDGTPGAGGGSAADQGGPDQTSSGAAQLGELADGAGEDEAAKPEEALPPGSGPFELSEPYQPDSGLELQRQEGWTDPKPDAPAEPAAPTEPDATSSGASDASAGSGSQPASPPESPPEQKAPQEEAPEEEDAEAERRAYDEAMSRREAREAARHGVTEIDPPDLDLKDGPAGEGPPSANRWVDDKPVIS